MHQVLFEDKTRKEGSSLTILAPEGEIATDEARGDLVFILHNGRIYRADGESLSTMGFEEYVVRVDLDKVFSGVDLGEVKPKEMTLDALMAMEKDQNAPSQRFQMKVGAEVHKRWALPVACLVLGLFAVPLACSFEGVRQQLGVVLSLVMFLIYYSIFSYGLSAGESGRMPPAVGLWMANVLFSVAAGLGIFFTGKERQPSVAALLRLLRTRFGGGKKAAS